MNWLQKISKKIETKHIPFQIYASLLSLTGKKWRFYNREKGYRDWSTNRNDKAIFNADYSLTKMSFRSGKEIEIVFDLKVFWAIPFDSRFYNSSEGAENMEFQAFMKKKYKELTPDGWKHYYDPEYFTSDLMNTPFDIAKWAELVLDNNWDDPGGFDSDGDDNPDNPDNPDNNPSFHSINQQNAEQNAELAVM